MAGAASRRGIPHPAAVTRPALSLAAVALALFGIARTTGSGWLIVLLAIVAAITVLAAGLPMFPIARLEIGLATGRDAMVGVPLRVRVTLSGPRSVVLVRVGLGGDWTTAGSPAEGWLSVAPHRRGIYDAVAVDVRVAAPLGLVWWKRSYVCPLERPLEVGPWPADIAVPPPGGAGPQGREARSAPHHGDDLIRGAREYRAGDPIKTVHWAASARQGELMVKELEAAAAPPVTVSVDLGTGGDGGEWAASTWRAGLPAPCPACPRYRRRAPAV